MYTISNLQASGSIFHTLNWIKTKKTFFKDLGFQIDAKWEKEAVKCISCLWIYPVNLKNVSYYGA